MSPLRKATRRSAMDIAMDPTLQRLYRGLVILGTILIIAWLYPGGRQFEYRYDLNEIAKETVIAPFTFPVLKSEALLEEERETARSSVPLLFHPDPDIIAGQLTDLQELFVRVNRIRRAEDKLARNRGLAYRHRYDEQAVATQHVVARDSLDVANLGDEFSQRFPLDINSQHWAYFLRGTTESGRTINYNRLQRELERIIRDVLTEGVLETPKIRLGDAPVAISADGVDEVVEREYLMDLDEAWAKARTRLQSRYPAESTVEGSVGAELLIFFIRPSLIYDTEITLRRQQEAVDRVPVSKGLVLEDEKIVDPGVRVTEEVLEKLNSLSAARSRQSASTGGMQAWRPRIAMLMITSFLLAFFYTWLYVYRRAWFNQTRFILLTSLLFVLILAMGSLFYHRFAWSEYLILFTVASMAFTILFDARTSMVATTSLAFMLGFMVGNKIDFVLVCLLTGSVAIYAVRQLVSRRQIFTAIIYIVSSYAVTITAIELLKYSNWSTLLDQLLFASINGLLSPIMVYGLIGVLEVIFGITTNLTLLELSDFNHPLLRRLSREANGTFSHSIVVGNLVEAAANAIGANSLLARVGAYYHDIGKLARPEYFIENQFHQENPHDTLAPHLSARVVRSHVKEGLLLAKEYGLPTDVADFIPMHHGTTRIEYFYQRAIAENNGSEDVKEQSFRYNGPRPNTRETGILMLSEAIEAAVRSIKEPTLSSIQQMVDTVIDMRMADSQLDECPLTLKELRQIRGDARIGTGIIAVLKGIYHVRIPYRTDQEKEEVHRGKMALAPGTIFDGTSTE